MKSEIKQLRAERDALIEKLRNERMALLNTIAIDHKDGGVLFIPDTISFPDFDNFKPMEEIAKATGMLIVCGPADAIKGVHEMPIKELVDIIEQAMFDSSTGLEAAARAADKIIEAGWVKP